MSVREHRSGISWGGAPASRRGRVLAALLGATVLTCGVGFLQKLPCWSGGWNSARAQYAYACYTDIYPLYFGEGLAQGQTPYLDHAVEYPVLIGAAMQATAWVVSPIGDPYAAGRAFYNANVVMLTVAALVAVAATAAVAGRRPERVAMFAVAPGLALAAYINWDLLAVALTAVALLAWSRKLPVTAGALLGLAVATKFYPLIVLGPLFLLCLRVRRLATFGLALLAAAAAWLAVNVPVYLVAPEGWAEFYTFSQGRGVGWGSVWLLARRLGASVAGGPGLNVWASGAFLLLCAAIAVLALTARRRPRVAQLVFLTVAAFVLTNKVWSPQYVLWLLPFAVLARPRWPAFLAWQAAWVVYFVAIWYRLLEEVSGSGVERVAPGAGIGEGVYLPALALRAAAVVALCALVVREVLTPERDLVRAGGDDDPAGGVLDGAPDRFTLRPTPAGAATGVRAAPVATKQGRGQVASFERR